MARQVLDRSAPHGEYIELFRAPLIVEKKGILIATDL
jgi:hypothetical protein